MPEQFRVPGPRSLHALLAVVVVVALVLGVTGMVTSWDYGVADDVPAAKVESRGSRTRHLRHRQGRARIPG